MKQMSLKLIDELVLVYHKKFQTSLDEIKHAVWTHSLITL